MTEAATPTTQVPATSTTEAVPVYEWSVEEVDVAALAHSWHDGCPVAPASLRQLTLSHWGVDGRVRSGRLVVHAEQVDRVVRIFGRLFEIGYPIAAMVPIGELPEGAEDRHGYANTSGFHCRFVKGTTRWSEHAFGRAIDINPHLNPLVSTTEMWPAGAEGYVDRSLGVPGMITGGDEVVAAFAAEGWEWGGDFRSFKDYHHFSSTGR